MSGEFVISRVHNAKDTVTLDIGVEAVVKAIRTGGRKLRGQIEQIRNRFEAELAITGGDFDAAKRAVEQPKKALPAVMWCGQFSNREHPAADKLQKHSGLFCADLDSLGQEQLESIREKLKRSPYLFALFLSPTGHGLKAVFRVSADPAKHPGSFRAAEAHVRQLTGVQIDESGKDISRLCYLSYDPELYHNPDAQQLEPWPEPEKPKTKTNKGSEWDGSKPSKEQRREMLRFIPGRPDYQPWITLVAAVGDGLPDEDAIELLCEWSPEEHPGEYADKLRHRLRDVHVGTLIYIAKQYGWTPAPKKSAATELVQLAEGFEFFHDRQDRPFVRLENDGHSEVWPVESSKFRKLLARMFYKHTGRTINRNAVADAITTLAGKACYDGNEEPVFLRVAPHGENILIDLCNDQWRVVEVTPDGWRILDKSPVAFIRTGSMQSLPEPVQGGGSIAPLWELLNVTEAQRPLVGGGLLNAFQPDGPYYVVNYVGEQGTAKTCMARIHRQLVDPNENPLRSPPKEERDLLAQAASNRCVALDNLSSLPAWQSDAICRLSTGGGHSARELYTDLEEISLAVKRPVILNGIEDVATRPDLAERCLQIELETIPEEKRISEKELWRRFDKHWSVIFSGILDALVCALRELPKIKLDSLPRMADAALWATAGEISFGWRRGTFMQAYRRNLDEGAIASVEAHPVGVAIRQLLEKHKQWSGTPAQLLETLNAQVSEEQRRARNWPSNPRALGHCLRRLAPALRRAGIDYQRPPREADRRIIQMCKVADKTSETSSSSCARPENDVCDDPDNLSPSLHVSNKVAGESGKKPMVL